MSRMKEKFLKDGCACPRANAQKQAFFSPSKAEPIGSLFLPIPDFRVARVGLSLSYHEEVENDA